MAIASNSPKRQFPLGQVVATPGALDALEATDQSPIEFIQRHVVLDPGELNEEDQQANADAVANSERIFSSFRLSDGETKVWIITEADRSSTTLLPPDEY